MTRLPAEARRYLDKRGFKGPWEIKGKKPLSTYYGAIVIPSLAEGRNLFATLDSLVQNPPELTAQFLVVVVVNQRQNADQSLDKQNKADLSALDDYADKTPLNLAWLDAATEGYAFSARQAGVGAARKLGMDLALEWLDWSRDPVLVCLDADTLVDSDYLSALYKHFAMTSAGAATIPFRHQPATSDVQQAAIDRYELFMRSYVFGLSLAGSPYAFNTVGSAMACRATAYLRCGGMSTRKAGEDFYFLQQLAKTDGVAQLDGTMVFPQPRSSDRVPFGTGRSVARLLDGDVGSVLFYPVEVFKVLAAWLNLVTNKSDLDASSLLKETTKISPHLSAYLERLDWMRHWPVLQENYPGRTARLRAFHVWFDGFRSLKLIHQLCDEEFGRGEPEELIPAYFEWRGDQFSGGVAEALELMRSQDVQ